jgi:phytoene dehydrogenase-like protein
MTHPIVVIGTGAAGLTAAAHLAFEDFDVLALERNAEIGGLIAPFQRNGFEFDPGLHYLGQCGADQSFGQEFVRLDLDPEEIFAPMDEDFDVYRFPDLEIAMCAGVEKYRSRLVDAFPDDVRGIDRVIRAVEHLIAAQRLQVAGHHRVRDFIEAAGALPLVRWIDATLEEYLDWACEDERLKSVLAAQCGDYGLPPSRASAGIGLAVMAHYLLGGWFPRGGSRALRDRLVEVAESQGAEFRTSTEVRRIETSADGVEAVVTADGERIDVDGVVGAIDPRLVYGEMLDAAVVPDEVADRVPYMESSLSGLLLFLGIDRDLRDEGWGSANVWDYPSWDIEACYRGPLRGEMADDPFFFMSPNSLKDPTGSMAPVGTTAVEVLTVAPWETFEQWADVDPNERGPEFDALKSEVSDQMLAQLGQRYPDLTEDLAVCELATPLSFYNRTGAVDGGLYGPAQTPRQSLNRRFAAATDIDGLALAGQAVMGAGVSTAMMSGRLAAWLLIKEYT